MLQYLRGGPKQVLHGLRWTSGPTAVDSEAVGAARNYCRNLRHVLGAMQQFLLRKLCILYSMNAVTALLSFHECTHTLTLL
jgi:hypothetical protein